MADLNASDLKVIYDALYYTKQRFEEYKGYPSEEFRKGRVDEIVNVMAKVSKAKDMLKPIAKSKRKISRVSY